MMSHLEDVRMSAERSTPLVGMRASVCAPAVAGEEHTERMCATGTRIRQYQHDGVLVDVVRSVGRERFAGRERLEDDAVAGCVAHPAAHEEPWDASRTGSRDAMAIGAPDVGLTRITNRIDA
ncbi:MAG: hypothetical protein JWN27_2667 [Candidatus Eremiobacteraeota bacterium]|nr:hypothetical protein [Candidatus Eremiobacteraeota bacterium]